MALVASAECVILFASICLQRSGGFDDFCIASVLIWRWLAGRAAGYLENCMGTMHDQC